jgi:hypothetical protein
MENDKLFWVLCLTLFLVIGLNFFIYIALRGKQTEHMTEVLHRFSQGVRNPWEAEDAALNELSEMVTNLRSKDNVEQEVEE